MKQNEKHSLKLLFIQPSYYPANQSSGPNLSLHLLAKALVEKGVDVTVYTTNYDVDFKPDACQNVDGVKVYYFETLGNGYITQITVKMYKVLRQNASKFDWVYITPIWSPILWYPIKLLSKSKIPFIVSPRGGLYPDVVRKKSLFLKKIAFGVIRHFVEEAKFFHYTTEDEKEKVENYWKIENPALIVPNGIDLSTYCNLPPKGFFRKKFSLQRFILHLGRINWKKGFDVSVPTFSRLVKKYPDLEFVIAGIDDRYKKKVIEIASKHNCIEKIRFVGLLQGVDKQGSLIDAEAFILPSYSENFGMACVEAMACGCPVVISENVAIGRDIKEVGAGLVVKRDVNSFYQALDELLSSGGLKEELEQRGKSFVRNYCNIDIVARKFREVIQ